jgi:hypothetical protein
MGKPDAEETFKRPRRWEDNIKMDLKEVGCGNEVWTELAQDRTQKRYLMLEVLNCCVLMPEN